MARPSLLPEWATSGVNITEPSAGKKVSGWVAGEAPPAGWLNWWQRNAYDWLQYVSMHGAVSSLLDAPSVASGGSDALQAFAGSATRLVAAGANGKIYSSNDVGRTWTARTQAGAYAGTFACAFWTGSLFILGGSLFANHLQTSPDGVTWTARTLPLSNPVNTIAKRPSTARIIVGCSSSMNSSDDGINWASIAVAGDYVSIAVADGKPFVAIRTGSGVTRANMIYYTTHAPGHTNEGQSWNTASLTTLLASDEYVTQVAYHPTLGFVCAVYGASNVKRAIIRSADGVTWERRGDSSLTALAHTNASKLVVMASGLIIDPDATSDVSLLFSADGDTWEAAPKSGFTASSVVKMGAMSYAVAGGATNGAVKVSRPLL